MTMAIDVGTGSEPVANGGRQQSYYRLAERIPGADRILGDRPKLNRTGIPITDVARVLEMIEERIGKPGVLAIPGQGEDFLGNYLQRGVTEGIIDPRAVDAIFDACLEYTATGYLAEPEEKPSRVGGREVMTAALSGW